MGWFLHYRDIRHERVNVQIDHQIFTKLRTHKVCYEDPGNKTDWFEVVDLLQKNGRLMETQ